MNIYHYSDPVRLSEQQRRRLEAMVQSGIVNLETIEELVALNLP